VELYLYCPYVRSWPGRGKLKYTALYPRRVASSFVYAHVYIYIYIHSVFLYILNTDIVNSYNMYDNETGLNVIAGKNIGSEVKVFYETPEDGLVKAETYVGVEE
jgi:hypothetical protein